VITKGSTKVMLEGKPAVFQGNPTQQNEKNTAGSISTPSQNKVMIMS
jgi:uncharacterized Zn-binding protein involved in type VI secretion